MTTKQRADMYQAIERQGRALLAVYPHATIADPVKLCKTLLPLERNGRAIATRYNNGELSSREADAEILPVLQKVRATLGDGPRVFVNWDGRGCAFKIREEQARDIPGLYRDMGGYGIIAPDLRP